MQNGKLVIFSAPSGAGKTTIVHHLLNKIPALAFSVSACSRPQRAGEINGKDYYFIGVDEFRKKIDADEFIEWQEVYTNNYYGTLKSELNRLWQQNKHVIFDVDVVGGLNLKSMFGDRALAVFVMPPSIDSLRTRLMERKTETPESIARRIGKAEKELLTAPQFDYTILNDNLHDAFAEAEKTVTNFLNAG